MNHICYIIAMRAEAQPLINEYELTLQQDFFSPLPCLLYQRKITTDVTLSVVVNGVQHDRDLIGCEAAAITTMAAIERLHPDIVISSGTCGGWQRYGMEVGKVYLGSGVMFHDRRVPGDNAWATQGLGNYPVYDRVEELAAALNLGLGKVTTGSSFDMTAEEEEIIDANGGRLKEMEGAAVAFVCQLFSTPILLVKAVTNLRGMPEEDMNAFHQNLNAASQALLEANKRIIPWLCI